MVRTDNVPQSRGHATGKHKLCAKKYSNPQQHHHAGPFKQESMVREVSTTPMPSDSSTRQTPLPVTRTRPSIVHLEDIKFRYLHGVLNLKEECHAGTPRQVTSTSCLPNELPEYVRVNFEIYKFRPYYRPNDLQFHSPTQRAALPMTTLLPMPTLKRTTNELPEDIMQKIYIPEKVGAEPWS